MIRMTRLFAAREAGDSWAERASVATVLVVMTGFFVLPEWPHRTLLYLGCLPLLYYVIERRAWRRMFEEPILLLGALYLIYLYLVSLVLPGASLADALNLFRKGALVLLFNLALYELLRRRAVSIKVLFGAFAFSGAASCFVAIVVLGLDSLNLVEAFTGGRFLGFGRADHPILGGVLAGTALLYFLAPPAPENFSSGGLKMLRWSAAAVLAAFVVLTESRTALLASATSVTMLLALTRRWMLLGIAVMALAGFIVAYLGFEVDLGRLIGRGDSGRVAIWADSWREILARPLFGHGLAVRSAFESADGALFKSAHNILLNTLYQGGLVGLLLLLAPYAFVAAKERAEPAGNPSSFLVLILVHGFVAGQFDFYSLLINLNVEWMIYWIPLVALAAELRARSLDVAAPQPAAATSPQGSSRA